MNILVYAPQMAAFGGMERHVCDLASVLARRGHRLVLLTTSNSLAPALREGLDASGVELRELARSRGDAGPLRKAFWLLRETLRLKSVRWDLVYTNGQSALARLAWFAARPQTRIVHHHHTAADPAEQMTWSTGFRRVLRNAPELVACSQATRRELARALGRDDVKYLPYLTRSTLEAGEIRERTYSLNTRLHFGFMGRLVAEKGIAQLCQLSKRPELGNITWHIHGAGPAFPPRYFLDFPNVVYHGAYASGSQQAAIFQSLDALALFSTHNEGMPLSLLEAMSAGLPWIATSRGGTVEIAVCPENCVVIEALHDLEKLAAGVAELASRIRHGTTSRQAQRAAYDRFFAPAVVTAAWCSYLEHRQLELKSA